MNTDQFYSNLDQEFFNESVRQADYRYMWGAIALFINEGYV